MAEELEPRLNADSVLEAVLRIVPAVTGKLHLASESCSTFPRPRCQPLHTDLRSLPQVTVVVVGDPVTQHGLQ